MQPFKIQLPPLSGKPYFKKCGCKVFADGGVIMCGACAYDYNSLRDKVGLITSDQVIRKDEDGKTD
jgi:hypothetical protein